MHVVLSKLVVEPIEQAKRDVAEDAGVAAAENQCRTANFAAAHGACRRVGPVSELLRRLHHALASCLAVTTCGPTQNVAHGGDRKTGVLRDFLDGNRHDQPSMADNVITAYHIVITRQEK